MENIGRKKPDLYLVSTYKNDIRTEQDCPNRHELNRIIKEAKEDDCERIVIVIRFTKQTNK